MVLVALARPSPQVLSSAADAGEEQSLPAWSDQNCQPFPPLVQRQAALFPGLCCVPCSCHFGLSAATFGSSLCSYCTFLAGWKSCKEPCPYPTGPQWWAVCSGSGRDPWPSCLHSGPSFGMFSCSGALLGFSQPLYPGVNLHQKGKKVRKSPQPCKS